MARRTTKPPQILPPGDAPEAGTRPYLDEGQDFRSFLTQKRKGVLREIDDLETEIDRLEIEIRARIGRLTEKRDILARCDAALEVSPVTAERPAPRLTERSGL